MKITKICLVLTFLFMGILPTYAAGKVFFAAPNGSPTNDGSQNSPWDLQTALNHRPNIVGPGDTIFLRGGVYKGIFTSFLVGTPEMPITVRSFPGEWAIIDGNQTLTLAESIGTGKGLIKFSGDVNLPTNLVVMIDNEHLQIVNRVNNSYNINARGWSGTIPSPHSAGAQVRPVGEILTIFGSDVVFGNFEVTDSKTDRILLKPGSNSVDFNRRYTGINVFAPRSKVINTVVHDTGQGIGFWSQAIDSEIYGNILYNNGMQAPDRGHGHGIYTQNNAGRKILAENITFGNFGNFGLHLYGSSNAQLRGFSIVGNINFLNAFLIGGDAPADDINIDSNYLYGAGFTLGYGNPYNNSVVLTNNYSYSTIPADIKYWQKVIINGNRFYQNNPSTGAPVAITLPPGQNALSQYKINDNSYIFSRSYQDKPFVVRSASVNYYNLVEWQKLTFDTNSNLKAATYTQPALAKPTGVDIFYRPNKYEKGRAHIIIYNFDKVHSLNLDLSKTGLTPGQRFEIRNGQNFKAPPIFSGVYQNQTVPVNFADLRIAQPLGNTTVRNPEIAQEFSVLVVLPLP